MVTLTYSSPENNDGNVYIDSNIRLQFSNNIEPSFISDEYFKLYRTNEDITEFYENIGCEFESTPEGLIIINPLINLNQLSYYILLISGGGSGIEDISGDTLESNLTLTFRTNDSLSPVQDPDAIIENINLYIDGNDGDGTNLNPSTDLFQNTGQSAPIVFLSSNPSDGAVGVKSIDSIIFKYNDVISGSIPIDGMIGTYNTLPFDLDPFADRVIAPVNVEVVNNIIRFQIGELPSIVNTEYTFTLSSDIVKGINRQGYDPNQRVIKFITPLEPLFAVPHQIQSRLKSFNQSINLDISTYNLYKLIHEVSMRLVHDYNIQINQDNLMSVNRLTICMVLMELLISDMFRGPSIKSRSLLATRVDYYAHDNRKIEDLLNDCINDSIKEVAPGMEGVQIGIKSGNRMNRPTKNYGVYR